MLSPGNLLKTLAPNPCDTGVWVSPMHRVATEFPSHPQEMWLLLSHVLWASGSKVKRLPCLLFGAASFNAIFPRSQAAYKTSWVGLANKIVLLPASSPELPLFLSIQEPPPGKSQPQRAASGPSLGGAVDRPSPKVASCHAAPEGEWLTALVQGTSRQG